MSALHLSPTSRAAARATRRLCDAQGGILFGPGATTLARVAPLALAAAGDRRPVLPPLAERLLALDAASATAAFDGVAADSGLAAALARALAELRRGEVSPDDLRGAAAALDGAPARRLGDLAGALGAYEARLADLGLLDAPAAARAAAAAVARGVWPEGGKIESLEVDGLAATSPGEWELLAALLKRAGRARLRLPFFPERPDLCGPAEPLVRRIEALHEALGSRDVELDHPELDGGRAPRLAAMLAAFAGGEHPRPLEGPGRIVAAPGAGEAGEAEAVADAALRFLEEDGLAPEELLVVSPTPRRQAGALRRAFAARGIPFAAGHGPSAAEVPVVQRVLELLASRPPLSRSAAARLLSSAWLVPDGTPRLQELLERAGALDGRGPAAAALRRRAEALSGAGVRRERAQLLSLADRLDALEASLAPLARAAPARLHARHLSALVGALALRRRAARGPLPVAARDVEALSALEEAADEVVRAAALAGRAEAAMRPGDFAALLGGALEAHAAGGGDEPAAGAVELLGLEEAGCAEARAVLLVGCAEGSLPAPVPSEPVLREAERLSVNRHLRRGALATGGARRAEAVHRVFLGLAAAREALVLSWAAPGPAGDGGPPAPLALAALAAAGVTAPEGPAPEPSLSGARTARAALRAAARLGASGAAALAATPLAARARLVLDRGATEQERRTAVLAGRPGPHAGGIAGAPLAALHAALPAEWTPSQLETHARCPFQAFVRLALRLDEPGEPGLDIEARREGDLFHGLLERFVSARLERNAWPPAGGPADRAEARALAAEVMARFEREGKTGDPAAWAARREVVLHLLDRLVDAEARDHEGLTPRLLELAFGGEGADGAVPALELSAHGETVRLRGRLDRVDAGPDRLLLIDYKRSSSKRYEEALAPERFGEDSFQIPAYLMVAARALPGRRLGATYTILRDAERLEPVELEAGDPRLSPVAGEEQGSFAAAVVERVGRMRRGEFPIVSQGCEWCAFGAVCRFQGQAEQGAAEPKPGEGGR